MLGLPLQLFPLRRLRERAHLWAELVTGAVLRGPEALLWGVSADLLLLDTVGLWHFAFLVGACYAEVRICRERG